MNETYLITGASSDLAGAFLEVLGKRNETCTVLCQYHSNKSFLDEITDKYGCLKIVPYAVDLSEPKETEDWLGAIKAEGHEPDHILHIAAEPFSYVRIKDFNWDDLSRQLTIQVNTFGQILKAFLPSMGKKRQGKVVAILSAVVLGAPPKFMSEYIVTKYALLGLIKSAAADYAEKGVNINAISPNMMDTKFLKNLDPRQIEIAAQGTTLKRNIKVEEVVRTIEYLMSDASDYMTGVNINLTGGDRM